MATQLQIRRGTTSQMNAFTGAEGEIAVNTTSDTLHVHDGSTAGGHALAKADGSNIGTYAGSFTTISASGAITGNVTGNLTGSVLTAAQTNITSLGTLSTLAVTGALTVDTNTLVVDATNNRVGIGTSIPDTTLHLQTPSGTKSEINFAQTAVTNYRIGVPASTDALVFTYGGSTERMRIDSSGNLLVGTTSLIGVTSAGALHIKAGGGGPYVINCQNKDTSGGANQIQFKDGSGDVCGAIISNATSNTTAYGTSSDYRLKENVSNITEAIEKLKLLQPKTYSFIADSQATLQDGFLAHELATVIPNAVCGEKDDENEDGSLKSQQVDYGLVTPLLTAALQEAITKIESLTSRITELENN